MIGSKEHHKQNKYAISNTNIQTPLQSFPLTVRNGSPEAKTKTKNRRSGVVVSRDSDENLRKAKNNNLVDTHQIIYFCLKPMVALTSLHESGVEAAVV